MKWLITLLPATLLFQAPVTAQAPANPRVVIAGSDCDGGACEAAPASVYTCIATALTPDPVSHGRIYEAVQRARRSPGPDSAERLHSVIEKAPCGAKSYRIQMDTLQAAIERTPFIGRTVTTTGLLMKDQASNIRVQLPNGSYPWILEPASVNSALMGSAVRVEGVTTGPRRLRVVSMVKTEATPAIMAPASTGQFIWCRTVGDYADTTYSSTVFPGRYLDVDSISAAFADYVAVKYGYRSRLSPACMFDRYIQNAFLRLKSSNNDTRFNKRQMVETEWRYGGSGDVSAKMPAVVTPVTSTNEACRVEKRRTPSELDELKRKALSRLGQLGSLIGKSQKSTPKPSGCP